MDINSFNGYTVGIVKYYDLLSRKLLGFQDTLILDTCNERL